MICKSDPATYLWNGTITGDRTCLLVQTGENGTPAHAFIRKMPSRGETVVDKQTGGGRNIMSSEEEATFHIPRSVLVS